ncbi:hypothetical protein GSI_00008 [Ganoderma sinense ZZ0214-1]|uniref:Uncharacterized protein n=1 Tax=Ganoderma sinense ZZ0214-1 TaxID=1077348 RepID=A0A2G8SRD4_9APHY|nr:hypothetical protein GSI_00008 [Ganoderma sinense ZZ0214-1]
MSLDNNSTAPDFRSLGINTIALDIVEYYARGAGFGTAELALSSLSFATAHSHEMLPGVLTTLSFTSMYFLIRRRSPSRTSTSSSVRVPLLGTLILYLSTGTYMAALVWNQSSSNRIVTRATSGLFSPSYDGRAGIATFQDAVLAQSWMLTIAAVLNFVVGDAIVWWRAAVIWQHKAVSCVGALLTALTLVRI